ncbi:MAG: hypothetical protein NWE88_03475 [Candidatus Bathyarchaeota archaeon]|nr:hypothetical protein [Candidatus Bathyarchaeota archaeon]
MEENGIRFTCERCQRKIIMVINKKCVGCDVFTVRAAKLLEKMLLEP